MTHDVGATVAAGRASGVRRRTVLVAGLLYLATVAVLALVWPVSLRSDFTREVVVGPWTDDVLVAGAASASLALLGVIVFAVPARRWWWLLLAPLRLLRVGATVLAGLNLSLTGASVTPIVADGCATGYVVSERAFLFAASGRVLRMDGIVGTVVGRTTVDDGHTPFAQGSYIAVAEGDSVRVWQTVESDREVLSTSSAPSFVLPRLNGETGCGLAGGLDPAAPSAPEPTPTLDPDGGPRPSVAGDARAEVSRMAALTLAASTGTPTDAAGSPVSAPSAADLPCDGTTGVDLAFATDDNAASYAAVLAAWTDAGFASDRAMQEDLRYDGVVRLSARDRSTIDGLLHFSLTAECRAG